MEFEWDAEKDAVNRAKHGLSLGEAVRLDWARGKDVIDLRADYGEDRITRYSLLDARLFACVYTIRNGRLRIISLRKANKREIRDYGRFSAQTFD